MLDPERWPSEDKDPNIIELTEEVSSYREMTPEEKAQFENIQVHGERTESGTIVESAKKNLPYDKDRGQRKP